MKLEEWAGPWAEVNLEVNDLIHNIIGIRPELEGRINGRFKNTASVYKEGLFIGAVGYSAHRRCYWMEALGKRRREYVKMKTVVKHAEEFV